MNLPGKRLLLGTAIAAAALGIGGVAYAAGSDPAPEQGYVTIEDGATTPSPGTGTAAERDCPEKNGSGQGQGSTPEQTQPEQTQPEQGQAEQGQADPQGNA